MFDPKDSRSIDLNFEIHSYCVYARSRHRFVHEQTDEQTENKKRHAGSLPRNYYSIACMRICGTYILKFAIGHELIHLNRLTEN